VGFGAGEKDLSSKGLFPRPNSLNLFYRPLSGTAPNKKGSMSSSAKQRTFSEKKGTIFFVPESVIHRN